MCKPNWTRSSGSFWLWTSDQRESCFGRVSLYIFRFFGLRVKCAAMNFNSTTLAQGQGKIQGTRNATDAA